MVMMPISLAAFDIETADMWQNNQPGDVKKLGISCAAVLHSDIRGQLYQSPQLWYGRRLTLGSKVNGEQRHQAVLSPGGVLHHAEGFQYRPRMTRPEASDLLTYLSDCQSKDKKVVTWNGMFDFQVLGAVSGQMDLARHVALEHVDLMLSFFMVKGYPLSLKKAALACEASKGVEGLEDGAAAPELWRSGQHELVLRYVAQDVTATMAVARFLEKHRQFIWISNSGRENMYTLPRHVTSMTDLVVHDVMEWDMPDQDWMSAPIPLGEFTAWLAEGR